MILDSLGALGMAIDLIAKPTVVLATAAFAVAALHRASASVRHLIWLLALGGTVAVVAISPAVPSVPVRLPVSVASAAVLGGSVAASGWEGDAVASTRAGPNPSQVADDRISRAFDRLDASAALRFGSSESIRRNDWRAQASLLLVAVWMLGGLIVLVRCLAAHVTVARLVSASVPVTGATWRRVVDDAAARMHVRRRVAVVLSDAVGGPVTSGFRQPVVLLPLDADEWTDERRRVVLLHEMAHIARGDYVAQLVATAACALFWFHPAVWLAARRMRMEAEHAADDRVLSAGLTSDRYATHLVELARRAAIGEPAAVAVGIAHRTHIERRVRAMLDTTRSRTSLTPRARWVATVAALAVLVPVAGLRTEAEAAPASPRVTSVTTLRLAPAIVRPVASLSVARPAPLPTQRRDSAFERTVPAEPGGRLVLDLDSGGEVSIHGWDEPRARLRVRLAGRDWRDTRVEFERVDGGIRLRSDVERSRNNTQTSHEFELWVPRRSDVQLSSAGGSVSIEDVEGRFSGHTGGGTIDIRGAKGRSTLSTGGGDINVSQSNLTGSISTGGGAVVLSQVSGGLRGSSGSGPVIYGEGRGRGGRSSADARGSDTTADLRSLSISSDRITTVGAGGNLTITSKSDRTKTLRGSSSDLGRLHISKAGGAIRLDDAPDGGTVRTGGGSIVIERSGGELTASTGGGDIEIRRVTGSAAASTGSGDIRITVVDDDGREHTIEASSGHGTVELILPRSIDARFELESAYTEGFGRRTKIDSDWTLERSESRDWESPNGSTPRKYVRGNGVFGSGRGHIRVTTVNGDVIVRRAGR